MEQILNIILQNTYTLSQLKHRIHVLKSYLLKTLFGGSSQTPTLTDSDLNWLKSLSPAFYQQFNKDNLYQIFDSLERLINQLIPLTIFLSFETNDEAISSIGQFARITFANPLLLLDTKYDPNLLAGCALSWKGVYRDFSLRAKIEERKSEILEGFKKFLR